VRALIDVLCLYNKINLLFNVPKKRFTPREQQYLHQIGFANRRQTTMVALLITLSISLFQIISIEVEFIRLFFYYLVVVAIYLDFKQIIYYQQTIVNNEFNLWKNEQRLLEKNKKTFFVHIFTLNLLLLIYI